MKESDQIHRTATAAASWWAARLETGDRDAFTACLIPLIESDLRGETEECLLKVDYDPQGHLLTAVRAAGVECSGNFFSARGILPEKTIMRVTDIVLMYREGYGAKWFSESTS